MTINSDRFRALNNSHTEFREHQRRDAARPVNHVDQNQLKVFLERDIDELLPVQPLRQKYLNAMQDIASVNEVMAAAAKAYYVASQLTSKAFIETYFPSPDGLGMGDVVVGLTDFDVQVKVKVERLVPISYDEASDEILVHMRCTAQPPNRDKTFHEFGVIITPMGYWRVRSATKHTASFNPTIYSSMTGLSMLGEPTNNW